MREEGGLRNDLKKCIAMDCPPRHGDKTEILYQDSPYLYAVLLLSILCPYFYIFSYTVHKQTTKKIDKTWSTK